MKKTSFQREIISKIRKLREEVNMSQVDFARLLDISPGVIGNIESLKYSHNKFIQFVNIFI